MATDTLTTEARDALAATPTRDLLRAAYALTHRMDSAERNHQPYDRRRDDLRAQRDLIDSELERRTILHDLPLPDPRIPGFTHTARTSLEDGAL